MVGSSGLYDCLKSIAAVSSFQYLALRALKRYWMKLRIADLFTEKEKLFDQIKRIDDLIRMEIDGAAMGSDRLAMLTEAVANPDMRPEPANQERQSIQPEETAQTSDYTKLTWTKKLLHHLRLADGRGMSTSELTSALKRYHQGEWKKPSISVILNALEKSNRVSVDRTAGRNRYFIAQR